jgi:hypothetical protein
VDGAVWEEMKMRKEEKIGSRKQKENLSPFCLLKILMNLNSCRKMNSSQ